MSTSNIDFEQQSENVLLQQKKIYDKMDFSKVFADKKETIRHFIESEDLAKEYVFQGRFYCMAHYEIAKILKTKMKGFEENEIVKTLYHTLRHGNFYKIDGINYPYLQKALTLLLDEFEESKYLVCQMDKLMVYLLFEVLNSNDQDYIYKTSYKDYSEIRDFIWKSHSYRDLFNMRKNAGKFIVFLENKLLVERAKKAVLLFSANKFHQNIGPNFYFAACILLLLLSDEKESKETFLQLHKQELAGHLVWVLGTFYKDFQNIEANNDLLLNLYETYSHDLIDEYQEKKYDWENNN
ncbi:hypothetical protein [Flavobacterium hydrophilum]|uniref:Uncharacterized protein n=1 Tax=Flavobacterium hydrophilum TaxID=2211445 RepID=A0A2V4C6K4_9FLAO|nr:hypothetical protein [Flavobacterium hydrophilum]PXY46996.1 hypothetical protein DMB68_07570 [Flavobacterium hydrophilum]